MGGAVYPPALSWQFLCDEGAGISGDYIDRVDEPLSCSYVLTIRTPRLCSHPLLRPLPSAAPQAILCHPSLQPEEYKAYLQQQEGERGEGLGARGVVVRQMVGLCPCPTLTLVFNRLKTTRR